MYKRQGQRLKRFKRPLRPPGRRAAFLAPRLAAPQQAIFFVPPPRAARRQDQTCPVEQPQTARQPRRQRRVARLSGTATVCTENRENPRTAPFRVPLPWPPRGGLGAGGQGVIAASQVWPEKTYRTPRPRRNTTKPSAPRPVAPSSWTQRLRRPHTPFSSYPPPRATWRQTQTRPVGQPQTGRQPRRQRRVARPSAAATVCTENRENPRTAPFRVPLPWPFKLMAYFSSDW